MLRATLFTALVTGLLTALSLGAMGCGGGGGGTDGGHTPGMDSGSAPGTDAYVGPRDGGSCTSNTDCPGTYCNTGNHSCCVPAVPPIELCGDHIDQDCNGHDASCGDQDGDTFPACVTTADFGTCDCDDSDPQTYPAARGLPGGAEACDGKDNDCDGRIDESAACCAACQALGNTNQGDICGSDGSCQCSTNAGMAACGTGQACCASGCVDTSSDLNHCGSCNLHCTDQTDRCVDSRCYCGPPPGAMCMASTQCHDGACQ